MKVHRANRQQDAESETTAQSFLVQLLLQIHFGMNELHVHVYNMPCCLKLQIINLYLFMDGILRKQNSYRIF